MLGSGVGASRLLPQRGEACNRSGLLFLSVDEARRKSNKTLKTEEVVLLPTCLGRRTSKIHMEEIPPEIEVNWVMAAL